MAFTPNRMLITGGPATGKTQMARQLGYGARYPVLSLDEIYWDRGFSTRNDPQSRAQQLAEAVAMPRWVIEGAYCDEWVDPAYEAADSILILQASHLVQTTRLIKRAMENREPLSSVNKLLSWQTEFDRRLALRQEIHIAHSPKTECLVGSCAIAGYLSVYGVNVESLESVATLYP